MRNLHAHYRIEQLGLDVAINLNPEIIVFHYNTNARFYTKTDTITDARNRLACLLRECRRCGYDIEDKNGSAKHALPKPIKDIKFILWTNLITGISSAYVGWQSIGLFF